jgi:hypothetical protein
LAAGRKRAIAGIWREHAAKQPVSLAAGAKDFSENGSDDVRLW